MLALTQSGINGQVGSHRMDETPANPNPSAIISGSG